MKKKPAGILIQTWHEKVRATKKTKCSYRKICWLIPDTDRCIYGGPFFIKEPEKN